MAKHIPSNLPVSRPASEWQRRMVERLIAFAPDETQAGITAQLDRLRVTRECNCGCLSVDFACNSAGGGQVLDGVGDDDDGMTISVLLHLRGTQVSALEVFRDDGQAVRKPPAPAQIDRVEWDELGRGRGATRRRIPES